jgi:transposase-like protein
VITAKEAKHQYLLREWAEKITERYQSDMSVKDWCAANGINVRMYYYWLRQVREYAAQFLPPAVQHELVTVGQKSEDTPPTEWTLAKVTEPDKPSCVNIKVGSCVLTATEETNLELLLKVCKALETLC